MELIGNLNRPNVFVIGVFHGDEPQGKFLTEKYYETHKNTNLLLLPCLNETGYKKGTRKNSNGVDLNRNFPTKNWELTNIEDDYFGGISPASEVETKFIINSSYAIQNRKL